MMKFTQMPRFWIHLLCLLWPGSGQLEALFIKGTNTQGIPFHGELIHVTETELLLRDPASGISTHRSIQLANLTTLSLLQEPGQEAPGLHEMESLQPALHLLDAPSIEWIQTCIGKAAKEGHWQAVFFWSERIGALGKEDAFALQMNIFRIWALIEMGLFQRAVAEAEYLQNKIDPMEASTRFCWIMAKLAQHSGQIPDALDWARLPSLQIPAKTDALADELNSLIAQLQPSS